MARYIEARKPIWITGRTHYQDELANLGYDGFTEVVGLLCREPENLHDANAIRLDIDGTKVGYMPRTKAAEIGPYMDAENVTAFECKCLIYEPDNRRTSWAVTLLGVYRA